MEASRVCVLVMKSACQKSPNSCLPLNSFEYTIKKFRKIFYYFFFSKTLKYEGQDALYPYNPHRRDR